jgi:hypothetical protein
VDRLPCRFDDTDGFEVVTLTPEVQLSRRTSSTPHARFDVSHLQYGEVMSDDERPWEPPRAGTELEHLHGALNRLRATFRWKVDDLDAAQLRATIPTSSLTIASLLKHLAHVEADWTTWRLDRSSPGDPWASVDWDVHPDWAFETARLDNPDDLYRLWDDSVARARERFAVAVERGGLDQEVALTWQDGTHPSLRRVLCDVIEEYGRHTGHADLLREAIDGRVGEDPPDGWRPLSPRSS